MAPAFATLRSVVMGPVSRSLRSLVRDDNEFADSVFKQPIRRHCEERSDEAIQSAASGDLDCFASLAMTWKHACPFPQQVFARVLQIRCPSSWKRAQGKPGADCARSPVCESSDRKHTG